MERKPRKIERQLDDEVLKLIRTKRRFVSKSEIIKATKGKDFDIRRILVSLADA